LEVCLLDSWSPLVQAPICAGIPQPMIHHRYMVQNTTMIFVGFSSITLVIIVQARWNRTFNSVYAIRMPPRGLFCIVFAHLHFLTPLSEIWLYTVLAGRIDIGVHNILLRTHLYIYAAAHGGGSQRRQSGFLTARGAFYRKPRLGQRFPSYPERDMHVRGLDEGLHTV